MRILELQVNGTKRRVEVDGERFLLNVLRDDLDLTGAKYGCGEGQCGACTVLVDGRAARSCLTQVASVEGKQITTIEGLERNGRLHPLQEAFLDQDAMQCGYCTAGMIMSGVGLLKKTPNPNEPEIQRAMEGNICRCGTYHRVVAAIRQAANGDKAAKGGAR
jgi:aerobic-type carbon monoxide dehydrogenase small subunit (CoxS/CutS family)